MKELTARLLLIPSNLTVLSFGRQHAPSQSLGVRRVSPIDLILTPEETPEMQPPTTLRNHIFKLVSRQDTHDPGIDGDKLPVHRSSKPSTHRIHTNLSSPQPYPQASVPPSTPSQQS